jgi:hypothetical protein
MQVSLQKNQQKASTDRGMYHCAVCGMIRQDFIEKLCVIRKAKK